MKRNTNYTKKDRISINMDGEGATDVSYFNKNEVNFNQATSLPFIETVGQPMRLADCFDIQFGAGATAGDFNKKDYTVPGIMRSTIAVGPGWAAGTEDAVNKALITLMSDIYAATSSSTIPFQQGNLGMFMCAMGSIANLIAFAKRVMMCKGFWADRNAYYPIKLVSSMGIDYSDLVKNWASYLQQLNEEIDRFNNLKVLEFVDIYKREYSLFRNIYVDEDSELGQINYFTPYNYYIYEDVAGEKVGKCVFKKVEWYDADAPKPLSIVISTIKGLIDKWYGTQDLYYIRGYLMRAMPDSGFFTISELTNEDKLEPVVNEQIQMQVMNANVINIDPTTCDIECDPTNGIMLYKPQCKIFDKTFACVPTKGIPLRVYSAEPTNNDVMLMTRFTTLVSERVASDSNNFWLNDVGTEIAVDHTVFTIDGDEAKPTHLTDQTQFGFSTGGLYQFQPFRYIPPIFGYRMVTGSPVVIEFLGFSGDLYNYTILSKKAWADLNRVATLSLYKVSPVRTLNG